MSITLHHGDCLAVMATMEPNSVDSIVTDPPYGLAFMGKDWDHGVPGIPFWEAALRVARPGAHLLAFGGTRTFHRLAVAIEDAGWEIRDTVMWVYGSGFPKSHDVSKAIDREAGAERPDATKGGHMGISIHGGDGRNGSAQAWHTQDMHGQINKGSMTRGTPATPDAERWQGWGTALKPAWEPIIVARKPLQGTVAANVLAWGTGAINVDGCRVNFNGDSDGQWTSTPGRGANGQAKGQGNAYGFYGASAQPKDNVRYDSAGRWPANLVHDGSEEVVELMPAVKAGGSRANTQRGQIFSHGGAHETYGDTGSAARFYYCAKASRADRDEGLEGMKARFAPTMGNGIGGKEHDPETATPKRNHHPTVKPTDLMRYLCRLVTQPGGVVLDPFLGSGSTGKAAILEGFAFVGIEQDAEYIEIARQRIETAQPALITV